VEAIKILLASPDPWNHSIPYHIAPQRIARTLARAGHITCSLDLYGDPYTTAGLPIEGADVEFSTPWGTGIHATQTCYHALFKKIITHFKPSLVYLFGSYRFGMEVTTAKNHEAVIGFHQADPYWNRYPTPKATASYKTVDFITCNEGQAWNYLRQQGLEDKTHLLSHAIDPTLSPPLGAKKKYLCSTVMGGEDPPRMKDLTNFYYEPSNTFPNQTFIAGGGLWKNLAWKLNEGGIQVPYLDYSEPRLFNITKIFDFDCEVFPSKLNPAVLCHKFIHRLYSESYYGFVPWGWYLREGPQSKYNTRTFGTKIFEMGGSGAAMLSCWIHDIDEVIIDGKTGFILRKPEDTEKAFQYAIDNPEEVRRWV